MTQQPPDQNTILARYAEDPAQLEAALEGLAEADLDAALSADTWTIRQIVHHVVDGDDLWKVCIKMALGNSGATFDLQWYWDLPQDTWVQSWDYAGRAIRPSLALFRANRGHVAQLLRQIPGAWERYVLIKWPGRQEEERLTVGDVVEMQADHVMGHVDDMRRIREARVQLAILKLSEGRRERLPELVKMAQGDYRDVLAYAEYPEEMRLGFVGMRELLPEEAKAVRRRDREQYLEWLEG